jgi:hypothetical protein
MTQKRQAAISLLIFFAILSKDILVSYFELLPQRSMANRLISWLVILPLTIWGVSLSVHVLKSGISQAGNIFEALKRRNSILAMPILLYVFYFVLESVVIIMAN